MKFTILRKLAVMMIARSGIRQVSASAVAYVLAVFGVTGAVSGPPAPGASPPPTGGGGLTGQIGFDRTMLIIAIGTGLAVAMNKVLDVLIDKWVKFRDADKGTAFAERDECMRRLEECESRHKRMKADAEDAERLVNRYRQDAIDHIARIGQLETRCAHLEDAGDKKDRKISEFADKLAGLAHFLGETNREMSVGIMADKRLPTPLEVRINEPVPTKLFGLGDNSEDADDAG